MTEGARRATEVIPENGGGRRPDAETRWSETEVKKGNRSMNENAEAVDVSGLTQNPKALKKLLMAQIRAQGGTAAVDSKSIVQGLIKQTLEAFLELEMEEHLGYPQYAAEGRGSGNSRNGSGAKTVRGDFGEVEIETPRDRNGEFDPKIVAKRQTSVGNFTEAVISLYARGMSTREIEDHVRQIYGVEISPQFVSRATEQLHQQITDWQSRPLERIYPVVFVDGLRVAIRLSPRARSNRLMAVAGSAEGGHVLKAKVTAPPEAGRAAAVEGLGPVRSAAAGLAQIHVTTGGRADQDPEPEKSSHGNSVRRLPPGGYEKMLKG